MIIAENKTITVRILIYKGYTFDNVIVKPTLTPIFASDYDVYKLYSMKLNDLTNRVQELWYSYNNNAGRSITDAYTNVSVPTNKYLMYYTNVRYFFGILIIRLSYFIDRGPVIIALTDFNQGQNYYDMSPDHDLFNDAFESLDKLTISNTVALRFKLKKGSWAEIIAVGNVSRYLSDISFTKSGSIVFPERPKLVIEDIPES